MDLLQGPPVDRPAQLRDADRHRAHAAARRHVDLPGAAVRTFARQVAPLLRQHALGGRSPERRRLRLPHRIDPATQHVRRRTDRVRRPQLQGAAAARSRDDLARDARRDRPLRRCRRQGLLRRLDPLESPRSGGSRRRRQGGATPDGRPDEAVPRPDPPRRGAAQGTPHRLVQGVAAEIRTDTRRPHRQSAGVRQSEPLQGGQSRHLLLRQLQPYGSLYARHRIQYRPARTAHVAVGSDDGRARTAARHGDAAQTAPRTHRIAAAGLRQTGRALRPPRPTHGSKVPPNVGPCIGTSRSTTTTAPSPNSKPTACSTWARRSVSNPSPARSSTARRSTSVPANARTWNSAWKTAFRNSTSTA